LSNEFSRRRFLTGLGSTAGLTLLSAPRANPLMRLLQQAQPSAEATTAPITIQAVVRTLEINGRSARVMGLLQPNGTQGMSATVNQPFRVVLENKLPVPTAIHWHGLHPPNNQDGVPGVTQPILRPDTSTLYDFPLIPAGTHWMHSHEGLQEAYLLAAPLIVHDPADQASGEQEVIVMLGDFSFTPPDQVLAKLRTRERGSVRTGAAAAPMPGKMAKTTTTASKAPAGMKMDKPDANDWDYDAYLANDRTLDDPEQVAVEKNGRVRLRIINGSSGTNYFMDLGMLNGELIATDGMPVRPVRGNRFPLAIAQRIDVRVQIPKEGGTFPILALREEANEQTGIVLATQGATIKRLPTKNSASPGLLSLDLERRLVAVTPLTPRAPASTTVLRLQGNMAAYEWLINGKAFDVENPGKETPQVFVKPGERAVIKFVNETGMSHPMHLHGHSFQVIAINDVPLSGALRDTVLVPPRTSVTVAFDANNPGLWYVHCHVLWHLAAGMATLVQYQA
jgi:FtsP/CotA-like multicopper oxidase with cupredoxin domain